MHFLKSSIDISASFFNTLKDEFLTKIKINYAYNRKSTKTLTRSYTGNQKRSSDFRFFSSFIVKGGE